MASKWKSEAEFQSTCFKWYDKEVCNIKPHLRGRLMLLYNNPPNKIIGPMLVSMGLRKGAADHLFLYSPGKIAFIEFKIGYKTQSEEQVEFEKMVVSLGWEYYLVREEIEVFKALIKRLTYNL
jgi:hypothetical protein